MVSRAAGSCNFCQPSKHFLVLIDFKLHSKCLCDYLYETHGQQSGVPNVVENGVKIKQKVFLFMVVRGDFKVYTLLELSSSHSHK